MLKIQIPWTVSPGQAQSVKEDCWTLKTSHCCPSKRMSVTVYPSAQRNIPEDVNVEHPRCENLRSHIIQTCFVM